MNFYQIRLRKNGRQAWVEEELKILLDPETYICRPKICLSKGKNSH